MSYNLGVTPGKLGFRIKKVGIVDFNRIYSEGKMFFDEYKYFFNETTHKGKASGDKGSKLEIKWQGTREVDDFARFQIKVNIFLFKVNEIRGLYSCEMFIYVDGAVILDYKNKWETSGFRSFLFNLYRKHIVRREIEKDYQGVLYGEIQELRGLIKTILDEYD